MEQLKARLIDIAVERATLAKEAKNVRYQLRLLKRRNQDKKKTLRHICVYGSCKNKTSPHTTLKRQGQYHVLCDVHRAMRNKYVLNFGK